MVPRKSELATTLFNLRVDITLGTDRAAPDKALIRSEILNPLAPLGAPSKRNCHNFFIRNICFNLNVTNDPFSFHFERIYAH